jgi:glycosyltransferase involved in cell wall biosynthesis
LKADRAPIVLLKTAVDITDRWVMPDELVGTHCVVMLDDESLPTVDAIDCLARAAINAHAANSTTVQFGLGGAALLSETDDTFTRVSDGQYNMIMSARSSFSRYHCVREWFENASPEVFDVVAMHESVHCDDLLVSLLIAQHGFNGRLLVGATFTSTTHFGGRIAERHHSTHDQCLSQLRGAMGDNKLRLATTSTVLACASRPRPRNRVVHVVVMSNEFFNASRAESTKFGGFAQAASMYVGANFANQSFANFGAVGRVEITFVYGSTKNPPDFDHDHPVLSMEAFIADVKNGVRPPPALIWTIDLSRAFLALLGAFRDVPVLVWARNPVIDEANLMRASLHLPTLPDFDVESVSPFWSNPQAVLHFLTPQSRQVFFGVLDPLMTGNVKAYADVDRPHDVEDAVIVSLCNPVGVRTCEPEWLTEEVSKQWRRGDSQRLHVVVLARLDPVKRPWVALTLAERLPLIDFTFVGQQFHTYSNTTAAAVFEKYVLKPLKTLPNVRWVPIVDETNRTKILCNSDVVLSTSISEGIPLSLLEAMAVKVPFVAQTDTAKTTSRFGTLITNASGDGLQ